MHRALILLAFILTLPNLLFSQTLNQEDELGRKQGKWIKYYQNGKTRFEGQFKDDRPYGEFKNFYESGNLQAVSKYSDDGVICKINSFHENGKPLAEGTYINQKKDGKWLFYSDIDGKIVAEESYSMDILEGRKVSFYPETGEPAEITFYKQGKKEGVFQKFYPGGKVMVAGKYKNDLLDGEYTVYYENGQVEIHGYYNKGLQISNWEYFDENGKPLNEEDYRKQEEPKEKIPE